LPFFWALLLGNRNDNRAILKISGSENRFICRGSFPKEVDAKESSQFVPRNQRLIDLGAEIADRRPKRRKTLRTNTLSVRGFGHSRQSYALFSPIL
jgi:hypothetical protein